jgi:hypothetical protein
MTDKPANIAANHLRGELTRALGGGENAITAMTEMITRAQAFLAEQEAVWQRMAQALSSTLSVSPAIAEQLARAGEAFARVPERLRNSLENLGQAGWYLDPEMSLPDIFVFESAPAAGDDGDVREEQLAAYYRDRLPTIERLLVERHPQRARILHSAFAAHVSGEFDLSVPVLLAQADGICQEAISVSLYERASGEPRLAAYVRALPDDSFQGAALHPLTRPLPLTASRSERSPTFDALNRHQVLHGESVTYGTEINSLKAISFINYVSYALSREAE